MNEGRMYELASSLASAKSRQDVAAALQFLHPHLVLEAIAFGTQAMGHAENRKALTWFFSSFPDYNVALSIKSFGRELR